MLSLFPHEQVKKIHCFFVSQILMNVATVMISVTQRLTVQTLWDPTTVHVTWVLKETDSTANVSTY